MGITQKIEPLHRPSEYVGKEILCRRRGDPQRRFEVVCYNPKNGLVTLRDEYGDLHKEPDTEWAVVAEL